LAVILGDLPEVFGICKCLVRAKLGEARVLAAAVDAGDSMRREERRARLRNAMRTDGTDVKPVALLDGTDWFWLSNDRIAYRGVP
jgi:hypothetical protein